MRSGVCPKCSATAVHAVDTYICTRCGYFEHYVADPEKLSEVANTWGQVT